jgi:hypothetical protein
MEEDLSIFLIADKFWKVAEPSSKTTKASYQ